MMNKNNSKNKLTILSYAGVVLLPVLIIFSFYNIFYELVNQIHIAYLLDNIVNFFLFVYLMLLSLKCLNSSGKLNIFFKRIIERDLNLSVLYIIYGILVGLSVLSILGLFNNLYIYNKHSIFEANWFETLIIYLFDAIICIAVLIPALHRYLKKKKTF